MINMSEHFNKVNMRLPDGLWWFSIAGYDDNGNDDQHVGTFQQGQHDCRMYFDGLTHSMAGYGGGCDVNGNYDDNENYEDDKSESGHCGDDVKKEYAIANADFE